MGLATIIFGFVSSLNQKKKKEREKERKKERKKRKEKKRKERKEKKERKKERKKLTLLFVQLVQGNDRKCACIPFNVFLSSLSLEYSEPDTGTELMVRLASGTDTDTDSMVRLASGIIVTKSNRNRLPDA